MSPLRKLIVVGALLVALYFVSSAKSALDRGESLDSPIFRMGKVAVFGIGGVVLGLWLVKSGCTTVWRGGTFATRTCSTCGGSGRGSHYAEREIVDVNGNTGTERVRVNHCGGCGGSGTVYAGSWKRGMVTIAAGTMIAVIGGVVLGGWREFSAASVKTPTPSPAAAATEEPQKTLPSAE